MKEVLDFLKLCKVYFIATTEGDQPRVRPFGAQCEFDGKLYLTTSNQKAVYAQIKANPKVEISGMASDGRWIRVTAEAVFDERREARKAMLDAPRLLLLLRNRQRPAGYYYAVLLLCLT